MNKSAKRPQSKRPANHRNLRTLDIAVGITTLVLVAGGLWYQASNIQDNALCERRGTVHDITISGDAFSAERLPLARCDVVRVTNVSQDRQYRLAFGTHDDLVTYPGFSMQRLGPQEYFEISAVRAGEYVLHDHIGIKADMVLDIRER